MKNIYFIMTVFQLFLSVSLCAQVTGTFTDSRDGHQYRTIKIGTQTWMAENLAYLPYVNEPSINRSTERCYYINGNRQTELNVAKNSENYKIYGVLYNWFSAMDGAQSSSDTPSKVQGVCPHGWHIPSEGEWEELEKTISTIEKGLKKKIVKNMSYWLKNNPDNIEGFNALLGGGKFDVNNYTPVGGVALFWTSTEEEEKAGFAKTFNVTNYSKGISNITKTCGYSVRCIRDE